MVIPDVLVIPKTPDIVDKPVVTDGLVSPNPQDIRDMTIESISHDPLPMGNVTDKWVLPYLLKQIELVPQDNLDVPNEHDILDGPYILDIIGTLDITDIMDILDLLDVTDKLVTSCKPIKLVQLDIFNVPDIPVVTNGLNVAVGWVLPNPLVMKDVMDAWDVMVEMNAMDVMDMQDMTIEPDVTNMMDMQNVTDGVDVTNGVKMMDITNEHDVFQFIHNGWRKNLKNPKQPNQLPFVV